MVVMSIDRDLRFNHCCLVIAMFVAPSICNCKVGVRVCAMCVCAPLTTTFLKFNRTANPYKSKKRSSQGGSVTFVSRHSLGYVIILCLLFVHLIQPQPSMDASQIIPLSRLALAAELLVHLRILISHLSVACTWSVEHAVNA